MFDPFAQQQIPGYGNNQSFNVNKFAMFQSSAYDQQYMRPFTTHFDASTQNMLNEVTNGGNEINVGSLYDVSSRIITPSTTPVGKSSIVEGYGEQRFSFMLEVQVSQGNLGNGLRVIVTGYTSHLGVSTMNGTPTLDPSMHMYINNIFSVRDTVTDVGHGHDVVSQVVDANQVVTSSYDVNNTLWTMSPKDVFSNIESNEDPMMAGMNGATSDYRSVVSTPKAVARKHESRPTYLADTIKSFNQAKIGTATIDEEVGDTNLWQEAVGYSKTTPLTANPLIAALSNRTNFHTTGYITYGEMCSILTNLDQMAEVTLHDNKAMQSAYTPGQGEHWHGSNRETISATLVQHILPSIMSDCLLVTVGFKATNDVIGGQHEVVPTAAYGFTEGLDLTKYIQVFMERVKREILDDVSAYGQLSYMIEVYLDMKYELRLNISIDGQPAIMFVAPMFCDATFAPLVTNSSTTLDQMGHDINNILNTLGGNTNNNTGNTGGFQQSNGGVPFTGGNINV